MLAHQSEHRQQEQWCSSWTQANSDCIIRVIHVIFIHLPLRRQPRWWGSPALVMLKIAFNCVSKSPLGPLTFHQQLIKSFPFKDWLNFLAPKMKELLERRLKGTKRREGKAGTSPEASEEHSRDFTEILQGLIFLLFFLFGQNCCGFQIPQCW